MCGLVAATNRDTERAIADGVFRADLMYRINSFEINIPPLRERREDIEPLARHLLQKIAGHERAGAHAAGDRCPESISTGRGNVRQLRNCLERAVLLADNGTITPRSCRPRSYSAPRRPNVSVSYSVATARTTSAHFKTPRRQTSATSNASRSSPPSKKPAGTAARPPSFSASRLRRFIAAFANTVWKRDEKQSGQACRERGRPACTQYFSVRVPGKEALSISEPIFQSTRACFLTLNLPTFGSSSRCC